MKATLYIIMCATVLLLTACGQQHNAERLVKDFMEENIIDTSALTDIDFNRIDSTRYINDSTVTAMRLNAKNTATQYKNDIAYSNTPIGKSLTMVRVNYKINDKEFSDTYYMDSELTHIIAFKSQER